MECCSINTIAIMQQMARAAIPRKRFSDLPGRSLGGRILSHVEVNRVSPLMTQRNKYEQQPEIQGPHYQKIDCYNMLNVVL